MKRVALAALAAAALALPWNATAQQVPARSDGRIFVNVNAGLQTASPEFSYDYVTPLFDENASAALKIPGKKAATFDAGGGVRLVQNLGVGVTYSRYDKERTADLTTTIPSPVMYEDFSTIHRSIPLTRTEDALHLQAIYRIPVGSHVQVGVFGGPSYFRCRDDVVSQFSLQPQLSDALDWSVVFHDVTQQVAKDSTWGYHGGAEVAYLATRHIGLVGSLRYSRASHDQVNYLSDIGSLESDGIWGGPSTVGTVTMRHGGMHWNGGMTFRF